MVTAIVIPIICLYFYWLTKKEMRANHERWLQLDQIQEEAVIAGRILQINIEKQRFYYHKFVYVVELLIQTELKAIKVKKLIPLKKGTVPPDFHINQQVKLYGNWKENHFQFNRVESIQ